MHRASAQREDRLIDTGVLPYDAERICTALGGSASALADKTVLLTGSGGFLGRYIVYVIDHLNATRLLTRPCSLIGLDAITANQPARDALQRPECAFFINHDLKLDIGLETRIDFAIHAAGIASPHWYQQYPLETIDVAVGGSRKVLEIAKRDGARYLFLSSSEVYQTATEVPTPESYVGAIPTTTARSSYDVSKAMGETLAYVYWQKFGLHTNTVRIFNSFGPGLRETDHRILPRLASAIKAGHPLCIFTPKALPRLDPEAFLPTRTYCYAANTVLGLFLALLRGRAWEVYNIGVDTPEINVAELCRRAARVLARSVPYELIESPAVYSTEPMRRCPNIAKASTQLGYEPIVDINEGLRCFFDWALRTYTGLPEAT